MKKIKQKKKLYGNQRLHETRMNLTNPAKKAAIKKDEEGQQKGEGVQLKKGAEL
jgi:hypothetical protein